MPTTITSAGITFPDATSLTSATPANGSITTAKIADASVTVAKLGTNEQKQIAKAWVNFNGTFTGAYSATGVSYSRSGTTVTVTSPSHGLTTGYTIIISGATDSSLNNNGAGGYNAFVTSTGTNTFTFTATATGATTGTLNWALNGAIRSSYNVSSITKNGTGDYTVNFATAMADANYSVSGTASFADGVTSYNNIILSPNRVVTSPLSTANCRISTGSIVSPQQLDAALVSVQIFGN